MSDEGSPADLEKQSRIEKLYGRSRSRFPGVPEVTPAELDGLQRSRPILLVDVRNPEERAVSIIPGAITPEALEERWGEATTRPVVTYCTIGHRSGIAARRLRERGVDAYNLAGAILAWTHHGGELISAEGPTRRVHVSGPKWALQADGYEAVW
jgi:rhodanese-related sulfurtransferase